MDFAGFDFPQSAGCGKADLLRILMTDGDTSYLASKFQNNRTVDYKDNSYPQKTHAIYNSVCPKPCIAAYLNWSFADDSNSVVTPAFPPIRLPVFGFALTRPLAFLGPTPF